MGTILTIFTMIASLLGVLINVFFSKWKTYPEGKNRKKIRQRCNIILLLIVLFGIIFIICFFIKDREEKTKEYKTLYDELLYEMDNGEYTTAIKKINKKINYINNYKEYIDVIILKFVCLFGESIMNDSEKENSKIENLISEIRDMQLNKDQMTEDQELFIESILGFLYIFLKDKRYDYELQIIKEHFEEIRRQDLYTDERDIDMFLGLYYEKEYEKKRNEESLKAVIHYYENVVKDDGKGYVITIINKGNQEYYTRKIADYYIKAGIFKRLSNKKEAIAFFKKASLIYGELILNCDMNKDDNTYYQCINKQGACYCWLMLLKDEEEDYAKKSKENFRKLINMDKEKYDESMMGMYIFIWLDISQEEGEMIVERYKRLMKKFDEKSNNIMSAKVRYEITYSYFLLAQKYEGKRYLKIGKKYLNQISETYYDYFNEMEKENVNLISEEYEKLESSKFN